VQEAARAYSVGAFFVFLQLLERYANLVGKFGLRKVRVMSERANPLTYRHVGLVRPLTTHFPSPLIPSKSSLIPAISQ